MLQKNEWRKNLFNNQQLRQMNEKCQWQPYNYCRGNGWKLGPGGLRPDQSILNIAVNMYRIKGYRQGGSIINDNKIYNTSYKKNSL